MHRGNKATIHSVELRDGKTWRVHELCGCQEDSSNEAELEALVGAISEWD